MNRLRRTAALSLAIVVLENVGATIVENEGASDLQISDSSQPEPSALWSFFASAIQVAAAILAVLTVVVLLALAWRHNPSVPSALRTAVASVLDAIGNRRRRSKRMPSHVRHRLRLRLPAEAVIAGFESCADGASQSAASVRESPSLSAAWAPQMLSLYAKKQRQLQLARKDSSECETLSTMNGASRILPSSLFNESSGGSGQQTPRELLPIDFEESELTFFNRRLELLADN